MQEDNHQLTEVGYVRPQRLKLFEADAAQGIGGVDYLMTSETDSKDLIDEVG